MKNNGIVIVLSGPSGAGKSTIVKKLLEIDKNIKLSISSTTRKMRPEEVNGINYDFLSVEEFRSLIDNDEMIEYAMYCDNYYGTPKKPVEEMCKNGYDVVLEIEVNGAMQIKQKVSDAVMIFLMPPSYNELINRLVSRDTESDDVIKKRMDIALEEIKMAIQYDYIVVNDDIDDAITKIRNIISSKKCSTRNMQNFVLEVIQNAKTSNN